MEKTFLLEGLEAIAAYFEDRWKPESVKAVMPDLLNEPNEALVRAHARICAEMNPRPFPPIKRIADIIQEEGRRHRMERAGRHEEDWNREKGADSRGRVNGGGMAELSAKQRNQLGKDACQLIIGILEGIPDKMRLEGVRVMAQKYPGIGYEGLASRMGRPSGEERKRLMEQ